MKRSVVWYLTGKMLRIEALLLILPLIVGIIYQESAHQLFGYASVAFFLGVGSTLLTIKKPKEFKVRARDGFVSVALAWILLSFFGALPFVLTGEIPSMIDAFFEVSSGLTTTGSSILTTVSHLQHSSLFWRSFTHLIGGMGVLVFTLAILPNTSDYVQLMRAEVPGPVFGKLVSKLGQTARILYGIYLVLAALLMGILVLVQVPVFDAMLIAFGTAGTGGFAIHDAGFSLYAHPEAVEWIVGVGMLIFGINFNLYYFFLIGYVKEAIFDEELKYYLSIIMIAVVAICVNIAATYHHIEPLVRNVFFTVSSVITTTGFSTADFNQWPVFSQAILVFLMFVGGCAGSTAGGLKLSRVIMYIKIALAELKRTGEPKRKIVPMFSGKAISKETESQIGSYLFVYALLFILFLLSVSLEAPDFTTAFTSVAATFNNIGPGLSAVGPTSNFSFYSDWNKLVLSIAMIAGRLEIYPIILLFSPRTIKRLVSGKYT